jgi:carboxyl-terminal processing protease
LVNQRYIDPNFNGVNWAAQRDARRARALNAATDTAYYQELREMVWTLNDGHSRFMDPHEAFDHFAVSRQTLTYGGLGLYSFNAEEGEVVLQVNPGSPAERAGIQPCDHILTLNGSVYDGDGGAVGTTAELRVWRPSGETFNLTLTREEIQQVLDVPGEVLPNRNRRIGYVRIDTLWVLETPDRLRATLARLEADGPLDGLIIDLRPNLGGWRPVLQGILGTFTQGQLGEFYGRLQSDPLVAPRRDDPPPSHPDLPLVVLVSEDTESYAEVLAATLQAERGAIVIGEQTRGNVETIFPRRLPFAARVWIAEQGFRLNNGTTLEGIGVQPDVVDGTDWTEYACARDPQVEMAATLLENR